MDTFRHLRSGSRSITVEKEGPLYVKKDVSPSKAKEKSWQLKYIVLRKSYGNPTYLEWYESFTAFTEHKNPTRLKLDGIDYIGHVDLGKEHHYTFVLFGGGQSKLQMAAKTEAERSEWINALNNCLRPSPTSSCKSFPVELSNHTCVTSQDLLRDSSRDYVLNIGTKGLELVKIDPRGESKVVLTWLLQNIRSYESRTVEHNPAQRLLSIEMGRRSATGPGTFYFFTPHGDEIKNQISLKTKLTFVTKMNSQDLEGYIPYSSSPESHRASSQRRTFSSTGSPRRATVLSKDGPIPFDKYDPPTNKEGYGHYIEQPNGYIGIFTDQRQVEKDRVRARSRSNPNTSRSTVFHDNSAYVRLPPESQEGYIQVLPNESDPPNQYVDILPERESDPCHHEYVDVLGDEEISHQHEKSRHTESSISEDHRTYIEVVGDEEPNNQSECKCVSREDSMLDEIYIDVDQNRRPHELFKERSREQRVKNAESRERHSESRERHSESRERHSESRERHLKLSDGRATETFDRSREELFEYHESHERTALNYTSKRELHCSLSRNTQMRESIASVSSPSPKWFGSMTSQNSAEFSSFSSENDVFQEHDKNVVSEVFAEESANTEDVSTSSQDVLSNPDVLPKIALDTISNSQTAATNSENALGDNSLKSKDYLTEPPLTPKTTLMVSKSATLPTKSEGQATNSDLDLNGLSPSGDRRSVKARSWHSENDYNSENSTSTSESEHTRGSLEISEDENSDPNEEEVATSPNHSQTEGNLNSLKANGNMVNAHSLDSFTKLLTNPQSVSGVIPRHPPLIRERMYTNDQIISQLENPLQAVDVLPETKSNKIYICSICGWHKRSKKRSSLRPSFRTVKICPQCSNPSVTKQDAKNSKAKDRSGGGFFSKIRNKKRRDSDEKDERKDPNFMKPEWPSNTPPPLFVKHLNFNPTSPHTPVIDPKRGKLGIAPSPLTAISVVSIDRASLSHDDSISSGRTPLAKSASDGVTSLPNGSLASCRTISPVRLSKPTLTSMSSGSCPLGRSKSSPPFGGGGDETCTRLDTLPVDVQEGEKIPRKNSSLTLPPLPEDEDTTGPNHQIPGTPPPMIPPRPRAPPIPPRRGSSPLAIPRENNNHKLRRTQTDPAFVLPQRSPQLRAKNRISRTLTDPGEDAGSSEENIRHARSLGSLLEGGNEELLRAKIDSLSLEEGMNSDASPPPLPPRKWSGQLSQPNPVLPRRASNESDRVVNHVGSPKLPARNTNEGRRPGTASPKLPLTSKRSLEAKRADFVARKAVYNSHVEGDY